MKNLIVKFCLPAVCFGQLNGRAVLCAGDADGNALQGHISFTGPWNSFVVEFVTFENQILPTDYHDLQRAPIIGIF